MFSNLMQILNQPNSAGQALREPWKQLSKYGNHIRIIIIIIISIIAIIITIDYHWYVYYDY